MVHILINKDVFEPSYNDLKFTVQNCNYFCTNIIHNSCQALTLQLNLCEVAYLEPIQFSSVQSLSRVQLFATPWTAARQASLFITNSQGLLKLMSIESVMPSNHLILCHPLLLFNHFQHQGLFK